MAKRFRRGAPSTTPQTTSAALPAELATEYASRLRDPFDTLFLGLLRTDDPLLLERGQGGSRAFELYRDLRRDGKVFSAMQKRKLAVVGKAWTVTPVVESAKGLKDAETMTAILKRLNFDRLCGQLMDALLVGWRPAEVLWEVRDGLVVPKSIPMRAHRRFQYTQDEENQPAQLRLLTTADMLRGEALPDRKFIVHTLNAEDDNPYGTGLGLQLYWAVYFKRQGIVAWNKLNDRFGTPTVWGTHTRNAQPRERGTLADALRAFSSDGYVMTPEGSQIQLLESKLSGSVTSHQALCEYMDDWITEVLLGQAPRGKAGGAVAAASKEREDVRLELSQADSDLLSETLNSTLLAWLCDFNGFEPVQVARTIKSEEDKKTMAEADKIVHDMGFKMSLQGVRERYGEHWEAAPSKAPAAVPVPGQQLDANRELANFAEPSQATQDNITRLLLQVGAPIMDDWVERLATLVDSHAEPSALQDALLSAYGTLPNEQLVEVMALAMELAELQGRDAVLGEHTGG